ncbi:hypothetical protein CCY01nite_19790 [Chitinophaga cymbidii]|uniref:Uncharacterized protein n=1 Tax=Chitinophaga cymbidii TaxID=1096750 RepID=A0A512RJ39_9BACT|nr:hypothetical protein CCY01nite_19790 [Chitinophaga cymbidii]
MLNRPHKELTNIHDDESPADRNYYKSLMSNVCNIPDGDVYPLSIDTACFGRRLSAAALRCKIGRAYTGGR